MEVLVDRKYKKDKYSIGYCYVNGQQFSNTMEDRDRGLTQSMSEKAIASKKIYGQTAIPTGRYEMRLSYSPKFASRAWAKKYNGMIPEIMDVPGYSGIRIHPGSTAADTLGCILLGKNTKKGMVTSSQDTFHEFMQKHFLPALKRGERVFITIK